MKVYAARRVRTMDPSRPLAEAVAVRNGQVLAVGTRAELSRLSGVGEVVEVPGVLVPGIIDAHAHLYWLGDALTKVDLTSARSLAEVLERLRAASADSYQGEWLVGRGWDQNDWPDQKGAFPTREALDVLFPSTPVYLLRVDGHAAWLNAEGLRRSGITARTRDPAGGRIERDAGGEPTGVLVDNAMDLVKLPPVTSDQREQRLQRALRRCAEVGLTAVHDAGMDLASFHLLQQWDAVGRLPLRVYAMADGQNESAQVFLERGTFQGRRLSMRAAKLFADGALGSRGAALFEPYSDAPGHDGLLLLAPEELEARAARFMERGFQVAVHAIGDRANALAVEALERASARTGTRNLRHRLEHFQIVRPQDIGRLAAAGFVASMQPSHAVSDMAWAPARLGPQRLEGAYAWRSVLDQGVPLAFGSDFPVESPNPWKGIAAARSRQKDGQPEGGWLPKERLTGEQALHAFTVGAAYAAFEETRLGTLRAGYEADFVVVDVDPVEDAPEKVAAARVLLNVVAGREVYNALGAAP